MQKKIVGFDLDGVIIDHSEVKITLAKRFGIDLTKEQTQSDVIGQFVPPEILEEIKYLMYSDPSIAVSQPLIAGSREGLQKVKESGLDYFLITRRREGVSREQAIRLLRLHDLWDNFFNEDNIFFVENGEEKNKKAIELKITHFLDDEIKVLQKMADVQNRVLFDPFNIFSSIVEYQRVSSWEEFLGKVL